MLSGFRCRLYSTSRFVLGISLLLIFLFIFLFFPTYLLRKKRWGWWGSVGALSLFTLFMLYEFISHSIKYGIGGLHSILVIIVPIWISALILFLIDKKKLLRNLSVICQLFKKTVIIINLDRIISSQLL